MVTLILPCHQRTKGACLSDSKVTTDFASFQIFRQILSRPIATGEESLRLRDAIMQGYTYNYVNLKISAKKFWQFEK